jgi:DNA polymerase elongation subunit (family B)
MPPIPNLFGFGKIESITIDFFIQKQINQNPNKRYRPFNYRMADKKVVIKKTVKRSVSGKSFRLIDFHICDSKNTDTDALINSSDEDSVNSEITLTPKSTSSHLPSSQKFVIQMFGVNEKGETCSIQVNNYTPFFYVTLADDWTKTDVKQLLQYLRKHVGHAYSAAILSAELVEHNKLYGFTGGRTHKFAKITFQNVVTMNKTRNLWYSYLTEAERKASLHGEYRRLNPLVFNGKTLELYESTVPPLLRFFHIHNISPSGWIFINTTKSLTVPQEEKTTTCTFEYICTMKQLKPLNDKETRVPYKICSFDIEASSSHGDFPLPVKTYKRLASNITDVFFKMSMAPNPPMIPDRAKVLLKRCILTAFGMDTFADIDLVYPKIAPSREKVVKLIDLLHKTPVKNIGALNEEEDNRHLLEIDSIFEKITESAAALSEDGPDGGDDDNLVDTQDFAGSGPKEVEVSAKSWTSKRATFSILPKTEVTIIDILLHAKLGRDQKLQMLNETLTMIFPRLEGDKVTFIGSTFLKYGDLEPYLNHCLVLGSCDPVDGATIETTATETDLLLEWAALIQRENPDIIIGYNIFGFDYEFMFRRAQENHCEHEFLMLSRKIGEKCAKTVKSGPSGGVADGSEELAIENTKIVLATGEYDLRYFKMTGRLQIDMYSYFRRDFNLASYKLDDVAGQYISDDVKHVNHLIDPTYGPVTELFSTNLTGLHAGDFIHIEISGFTADYYKNGKKFRVLGIEHGREGADGKQYKAIMIAGTELEGIPIKNVKWGMAKDDVTPQDIFRLAKGSAADRAIVAKYCIQDCNLVHHLMSKIDVITGYVEMSRICSVPISFLVFRGQGIKLTSYVAKKCREKNTLIPDLEKCHDADGYEGAIVLPPKCSMYMDNPVACVDYASLYPSSMISQNFSHDSKVWTKEYDLSGCLVRETGEKDANGRFIYDELPGYQYIDIEFDTYKSIRKTPTSRAEKVVCGKKRCRWAQLPDNQKSIMPAILEELLDARKKTRKMIKTEPDPFMQNILDKRQLGYKVTANSLYGQCGAKTSTFYEQDVAASTTATGRQMITYAKRVIEEVYGDRIYKLESGESIKTRAEYVYGDSVASYTPVYVRVNGITDICTIEQLAEKYAAKPMTMEGRWVHCSEPGKQAKEFCELLRGVETWTDHGWTPLYRVMRHTLAPHKKIIRVVTESGLVDVTDDHSLLTPAGLEISPKNVSVGTELLHHPPETVGINTDSHFTSSGSFEPRKIDSPESHLKLAKQCYYAQTNGLAIRFTGIDTLKFYHGSGGDQGSIIHMSKIPYQGYVYDLTTANHHFAAGIGNMIVHNTDSVFFTFNLENPETGEKVRGKPALEMTIEIAQDVANLCTQFLKSPMELTYEKTLMPFILLSKKRYVGMLYETDANKGKMKYMGLSLKRRDSCDYLKDTYGEILNILMKENNIQKAIDYLNQSLKNLIEGTVPMDKLTITKALRSDYKNPMQIGHWVLADRIGKRDPGNKPKPGDRMKFVFIVNTDRKALMGDKIETPEFILENGMKVDYTHYITNQLMKPLQQLFGLALEQIWEKQKKTASINAFRKEMVKMEKELGGNLEIFMKKKEKYCSAKIKTMLFDKFLTDIQNRQNGVQEITGFFSKK